MSRNRKSPTARRLRIESLEDRKLLALAVAETLLVDLDARNASAGTASWVNTGTLGNFNEVGDAQVVTLGPSANRAVQLNNGADSAYEASVDTPAGITGANTRTIEAWVFNPAIGGEESLVSWGRRGGPNNTNMSLNYGNDPRWGAVGQWGTSAGGFPIDIGWGPNGAQSVPTAGEWHLLTYTYDGVNAKVYADGQFKTGGAIPLNTKALSRILVGAQRQDGGAIEFGGIRGELSVANVRVHDGVLSEAQVINNYNEDAARFGKPLIAPAAVTPMPVHRFSFNDAAPNVDSVGGAKAQFFNGATVINGQLDLRNPGNNADATTQQYALLPIGGTIGAMTNSTFETWTTWRGGNDWQRVWDLGDDTNEYMFVSPRAGSTGVGNPGGTPNTSAFEVKDTVVQNSFSRAEAPILVPNLEMHLVGVVDVTNNQLRYYVNGGLAATQPLNGFTPAGLGATINNFLGRSQFADAFYNGSINEFRVYNTALSASNVVANFLAGPNNIPGQNDAPVAVVDGGISPLTAIALQNTTAQLSQGGFNASNMIDADLNSGWANNAGANNVAVFETVSNVNPGGDNMLMTFTMRSGGFGTHELGKFRISVTTDDRANFADGNQNNGNLGQNWIPLVPMSIATDGTSTFTINADNTILAGGTPQETENYTIRAFTKVANITGIRLEALEDPSLPAAGPGRGSNGNFVVTDFRASGQVDGVPLQNPTATWTQSGFSVKALLDGTLPTANSTSSWADDGSGSVGNTNNNAAVFETVNNLNPNFAPTLLTFTITSGDFSTHLLGNIRLSVTNDDRSQFADGLAVGGDVIANWVQLTPISVSTSGTSTLTIRPDNTILSSGTAQERETYTIRAITSMANISGFRLEAIEDPALPGNGPGRGPTNGNFVVQEFSVAATNNFFTVSEDGTSTLNVRGNDFDPDAGDVLTISAVDTTGTQGTIVNNGTNLSYTPPAAAQALNVGRGLADTFLYTIRDTAGLTSTARATVVVQGANDAPTAVNDTTSGLLAVTLQNATSNANQSGFNIAQLIDGVIPSGSVFHGWANDLATGTGGTPGAIAVFETVSDLNPTGSPVQLAFTISSGNFGTHELANFRISVTTDARANFADGLQNGGDVTANWVQLTPSSVTTTGTSTFTIRADNTILAGGSPQEFETYTIRATTNLANITGFRIEAIEDPSLPGNGPGRGPTNGNFVVYEIGLSAATLLTTNEDTSYASGGILSNDFDIDGPQSAIVVAPTGARTSALGAPVTVNANGTFTYNPIGIAALQAIPQGQSLTDTFTYSANDGSLTGNLATVSILVTGVNDAPTGAAGGPYTITEGQALQLAGVAADVDTGTVLSVAWDLDNDGQFDDATGAAPSVSWSALNAIGINNQVSNRPISIRISDGIATPLVIATTLTVTNAPPTLVISAQNSAVPGEPVPFTFTATDPSPVDQAANFTYTIDWDGDGSVDQTIVGPNTITVTNIFPTTGNYTVRARVRDIDNGQSAEATHDIDVVRVSEENGVITVGGDTSADRIIIGLGGGGVQIRFNNKLLPTLGNASLIRVFGNDGADTITIASNLPVQTELYGGEGNDYLTGGSLADTLDGGEGSDRLLGGGGNDFIYGGAGRDTASGGAGNDLIDGGEDNDTLSGDAGNDTIYGGDGNDTVNGGVGNDVLRGDAGSDTIDGGDGNDALSGDDDGDKLYGRNGNDVLIGGAAVDTLLGGAGEDLLIGGEISDTSDTALMQLLADWTLGGSFSTRVNNLLPSLSSDATDDGTGDSLNGELGSDWYLIFAFDQVNKTDAKSPNVITTLP